MYLIDNPFCYGKTVDGPYFYGRDKELKEIKKRIASLILKKVSK